MYRLVLRHRTRLLVTLLCVLGVAAAGLMVACAGGGSVSTSATAGMSRSVDFTTEDGVALSGHLFGSGKSGVILAHMYPADQTSWYPTAERLAQEGYLALTFDFRGYGHSQGTKQIEYLGRDVLAAIRRMVSEGCTSIVLVGASMGGTACLVAADASQIFSDFQVTGVVTLSAPVEFKGLSAAEATPRILAPLLFIAAENDVGAEGARALQELAANKGDLQIVPGAEHGTDLLTGPQADQVWGLLSQFLGQNLPAAGM
jgi:pimeloyl-ACP methyl ester carboxylesterase